MVDLDADRDAWDRQRGEPRKAYAAFTTYRDAGPSRRSYAQTARTHYDLPTDPPADIPAGKRRQIERWASRWQWGVRVDDWDADQERRRRAAQEEAIREMADRHARAATGLVAAGIRRLRGDPEQNVVRLDLNELTARDVLALVTEGAKLERLSRGEPGESVDHTSEGKGLQVVFRLPEKDVHPDDRPAVDAEAEGDGEDGAEGDVQDS